MTSLSVVRLTVAVSLLSLGGGSVCAAQGDVDQDGISDNVERVLLDRFRPYYRFSRDNGDGETFRPTDVMTYLGLSDIEGTSDEGDHVLVPNSTLAAAPNTLLSLRSNDHDRFCRAEQRPQDCASSILLRAHQTEFYINPNNDEGRRGAVWPRVRWARNTGLYGHVVPVRLSSAEAYDYRQVPASADAGRLYYKIEYWQFFGYSSNNKPLDLFDHEGDWDTVQLIYWPGNMAIGSRGQLMSVLYYAHGKEMRFDLSDSTGSVFMEGGAVKELRGSNYNKPVPDLSEDGAEAAARNHVLRLFRDPVSGEYGHPVVFIEHGGHEFWPSPFWSYTGAQKHGGDDIEPFLTSSAPNLGEVEHPLGETPAALPILQFNGFWGTYSRGLSDLGHPNNPPPGPPLHFQWSWPSSSSIRWQLVGLTP